MTDVSFQLLVLTAGIGSFIIAGYLLKQVRTASEYLPYHDRLGLSLFLLGTWFMMLFFASIGLEILFLPTGIGYFIIAGYLLHQAKTLPEEKTIAEFHVFGYYFYALVLFLVGAWFLLLFFIDIGLV